MKVISYYTIDTPYEAEARALEKSLKKRGMDYRIEGLPAKASWVENCAQKASFIRDMAGALDESFWWLDADAELMRPLEDLSGDGVDIAAYATDGWSLNSGTVFFGNTPVARKIIDLWCGYCLSHPHVWDQISLMVALHNVRVDEPVKFLNLPRSYYKTVHKIPVKEVKYRLKAALGLAERPVVRQKQASRRFKTVAPQPAVGEFGNSDTPPAFRAMLREGTARAIDLDEMIAAGRAAQS